MLEIVSKGYNKLQTLITLFRKLRDISNSFFILTHC